MKTKRRLPRKRRLCHSALGGSHPPAARHFAEAPKDPAAGEASDSRSLALLLPSREQTSVRPSSSGFPRGPSPRILGKERRAAVQFGTSRCPARRRDRKGREGEEDEDEGSDDDPLAARGTTALAARMKDEWHCYHVSSISPRQPRRATGPARHWEVTRHTSLLT